MSLMDNTLLRQCPPVLQFSAPAGDAIRRATISGCRARGSGRHARLHVRVVRCGAW